MTILTILHYPDSTLRKTSLLVDPKDATIPGLIADMFETLAIDGIGLAAPQVDVLKRVVVIDLGSDQDIPPFALINPEICWCSERTVPYSNGCLSLPGVYADVVRPEEIEVKYLDENFNQHHLKANDLLAVCIQHEIDHLDGKLFIDHLSKLKREVLIRKFVKKTQRSTELP
ncbi:MAG: peptide deformylase [Holosporales bacterium]|jgi:peptide deformylase|nr:peptide deformylase [Holosporales bacterium]